MTIPQIAAILGLLVAFNVPPEVVAQISVILSQAPTQVTATTTAAVPSAITQTDNTIAVPETPALAFTIQPTFSNEGGKYTILFETNVPTTAVFRLGGTQKTALTASAQKEWGEASTTHEYTFDSPSQLLFYVVQVSTAGGENLQVSGSLTPAY